MKKEEIRKEFFKLKLKGHSYNQCRKILRAKYEYEVTTRTLMRWGKRLNETEWDLRDDSRRPKKIYPKITEEIENKVVALRKETGWGEDKLTDFFPRISHTSINKILRKHGFLKSKPDKKPRIKYVRFQREHPNSMWQVDHSDQKIKGKWCLSVLDDCSRYSLALIPLNRVTTQVVIKILDDLIQRHGKPREILTDNGSAYGGRSKKSKFDKWCRRRGIEHIRTAIHSPTTAGKVERLFQTMMFEMKFCKNAEHFRMRYNHFRPHTSLGKKNPSDIYFDFSKLF